MFGVRSLAARYRLALTTLVLMAVCPITTFWLVRPDPTPADAPHLPSMVQITLPSAPVINAPIEFGPQERPNGEQPRIALHTPPADSASPAPPPQVSILARYQPWLLGTWTIGAGLLGIRLLIGGGMAWRMRRGRQLPDAAWADRAARLAVRMGLRRVRVFVSTGVRQALVTGLWRPMVLLPAAWLAEMPADLLESVLAHELAHLRLLGPLGDSLAAASGDVFILSPGGLVALAPLGPRA